jgi:hypothetical protein
LGNLIFQLFLPFPGMVVDLRHSLGVSIQTGVWRDLESCDRLFWDIRHCRVILWDEMRFWSDFGDDDFW